MNIKGLLLTCICMLPGGAFAQSSAMFSSETTCAGYNTQVAKDRMWIEENPQMALTPEMQEHIIYIMNGLKPSITTISKDDGSDTAIKASISLLNNACSADANKDKKIDMVFAAINGMTIHQ